MNYNFYIIIFVHKLLFLYEIHNDIYKSTFYDMIYYIPNIKGSRFMSFFPRSNTCKFLWPLIPSGNRRILLHLKSNHIKFVQLKNNSSGNVRILLLSKYKYYAKYIVLLSYITIHCIN